MDSDETVIVGGDDSWQELPAGTMLDSYRIERLLGRGAMGEVYEVEHIYLKQRYALKLLPEGLAAHAGFEQRFRAEARVLASLDHPGIVRVVHFGQAGGEMAGRLYLAMEYMTGGDVEARLRGYAGLTDSGDLAQGNSGGKKLSSAISHLSSSGGLPEDEVHELLRQLLEALAYAHGKGVVHRDLKPANLLLSGSDSPVHRLRADCEEAARQSGAGGVSYRTNSGESSDSLSAFNPSLSTGTAPLLKIADFGLAEVVGADYLREHAAEVSLLGAEATIMNKGSVRSSAQAGTAVFMAPEVVAGGDASVLSDLYAVGVIGYYLLTGRKPVGRYKDASNLLPSLRSGWDDWLNRLMATDPLDRMPSASAAHASLLNLFPKSGEGGPLPGRAEAAVFRPEPKVEVWRGGILSGGLPSAKPSAHKGAFPQRRSLQPSLPDTDTQAVREVIDRLRRDLLDLTLRNPLLNFNHGRSKRNIRLVDEVPDQVTEELLGGRTMKFAPLPTEEDLFASSSSGIRMDHDLPMTPQLGVGRRHRDRLLQTSYPAGELESRLGNLAKLSRTAVEETGINLLYLVFGFLEWREREEEDVQLAPLFILPVSLERGGINTTSGTFDFELAYTGEDLPENDSLSIRLDQDFGIRLPRKPRIKDDNSLSSTVSGYLSRVEKQVKAIPGWGVRRYGTLLFLNFSNLLMHRDLDEKRWPKARNLLSNPLVNAVISGYGKSKNDPIQDAACDEVPPAFGSKNHLPEYPLVESADSSQMLALEDAMTMHNLVIEGPPGTGKSQTITNLIAAALHQGLTVLFVSEKMAALEVVKHRLEGVGLGAFCMELHSSSGKKITMIEALRQRLKLKPSLGFSNSEHQAALDDFQSAASSLEERSNLFYQVWGETGWTVHELFSAAARLGRDLPSALLGLERVKLVKRPWSPDDRSLLIRDVLEHRAMIERLGDAGEGDSPALRHPWRGLGRCEEPELARGEIQTALKAYDESLVGLWEHAIRGGLDIASMDLKSALRRLHLAVEEIREWEELLGDGNWVDWPLYRSYHRDGGSEARRLLCQLNQLKEVFQEADDPAVPEALDAGAIDAWLSNGGPEVVGALRSNTTMATADRLCEAVGMACEVAAALGGYLADYGKTVGAVMPDMPAAEAVSLFILRTVRELLIQLETIPEDIPHACASRWLEEEALTQLENLVNTQREFAAERARLSLWFDFDRINSEAEITTVLERVTESTGLLRWVKPSFVRDWWCLSGCHRKAGKRLRGEARWAALRDLLAHLREWEHLSASWSVADLLPPEQDVLPGIDIAWLESLLSWRRWLSIEHSQRRGGIFGERSLDAWALWLNQLTGEQIQLLKRLDGVGFRQRMVDLEKVYDLWRVTSVVPDLWKPEDRLLPDDTGGFGQVCRVVNVLQQLLACKPWPEEVSLSFALKRLPVVLRGIKEFFVWWDDALCWGPSHQEETPQRHLADALALGEHMGSMLAVVRLPGQSRVTSPLWERLARDPGLGSALAVVGWGKDLNEQLLCFAHNRENFAHVGRLNQSEWANGCVTLIQLHQRNTEALRMPQRLGQWMDFVRSREKLVSWGLGDLSPILLRQPFSKPDLEAACLWLVTKALVERVRRKWLTLDALQSEFQEEERRLLAQADERLRRTGVDEIVRRLQAREVPPGHRGVRVSQHTELALVNHETAKQRSHIAMRSLLSRAGSAVQALMPCFMMSPKSVAHYLEPGKLHFDLLVIDEASQMKPAEAIGAVARADGMIVVGDPKQLPPGSFFDRVAVDGDEDDFTITSSTSILECLLPIFPVRRLTWHYRSRDPSLIAFSNTHFYHGDLLLFPSPIRESTDSGIRFHRIAEGIFVGQKNTAEAQALVMRLEEILIANPEVSVGVAGMSAKQRDCIDTAIEKRAKQNPQLEKMLRRNRECREPLFIKNLENVQGDERDIMLISCTYGPSEPGGRVPLTFGPLLRDDGWRRLNVLFTRARQRMEVFSSMDASDIRVSSDSRRGLLAFREFLAYAAADTQAAGPSGSGEPVTDFQYALAAALADEGYACHCNLGLSGFHIDVAVYNQKHPERFILAVDSDTRPDTFHIRDRELLRHAWLRELGWKTVTVSVADFIRDPAWVIRRLLRLIEAK